MIQRAYSRCQSGHYFEGEVCPFDGSSTGAAVELTRAVARLQQLGRELSLEELRRVGLSEGALARTILIVFGNDGSVFEAVSPKEYVVNGEIRPPLKLGPNFK